MAQHKPSAPPLSAASTSAEPREVKKLRLKRTDSRLYRQQKAREKLLQARAMLDKQNGPMATVLKTIIDYLIERDNIT